MNYLFFAILLILSLFPGTPAHRPPGSPAPAPQKLLMTPYLQAVSSEGISVLAECTRADTVTVLYGPTAALGSATPAVCDQGRCQAVLTLPSDVTYVQRSYTLGGGLAASRLLPVLR